MTAREQREQRIADIQAELARIYAAVEPLRAELNDLERQNARDEWPEGPFTLRYWRYHREESEDFDRPDEALRAADGIEDAGSGSTERIVDRNGETIYDLSSYPYRRISDRYPDPDEVLG